MGKTAGNGPELRLLLAASEAVPFAKTGGLGDVVGSLPRALANRGHQCAVILPLYSGTRAGPFPITPTNLSFVVPIGGRKVSGSLWRATLPNSSVPVYLVEQPSYFERDDPAQGRGRTRAEPPRARRRDRAGAAARRPPRPASLAATGALR